MEHKEARARRKLARIDARKWTRFYRLKWRGQAERPPLEWWTEGEDFRPEHERCWKTSLADELQRRAAASMRLEQELDGTENAEALEALRPGLLQSVRKLELSTEDYERLHRAEDERQLAARRGLACPNGPNQARALSFFRSLLESHRAAEAAPGLCETALEQAKAQLNALSGAEALQQLNFWQRAGERLSLSEVKAEPGPGRAEQTEAFCSRTLNLTADVPPPRLPLATGKIMGERRAFLDQEARNFTLWMLRHNV